MKVFVVTHEEYCCGESYNRVVKVFKTEELAQKFIDKQKNKYLDRWDYDEYEVEEG